MTDTRRRPVYISDAPEHRSIPIDTFQVDDSDPDILTLTGYASTFQPYEMYGGPANGMGWIEQIDRRAFERTLKEGPDLHLLINHEGLPLARTKSGDLDLSVDDHGLKVVARLHRSDPDVQRLEPKMRKRPDQTRALMDEMSFAFRVKGQEWASTPEFEDDPQALRTITEVSLHKGDVSVVNWGANPTTSAELHSVSDALRVLAECDSRELVEARTSDDVLIRAKEKLANIGALGRTGTFLPEAKSGVTESESRADEDDEEARLEDRSADASGEDVASMIASLDAVLDEVCNLTKDLDPKSLPEAVAQALDLLHGAETIVGKLMDITGTYDPDENDDRMDAGGTEKRESVSDHAWNFPQSAYTPEQWRHACLIDTGKGDMDSKSRYKEPVREPDGELNRNGVHAAAGRLDQVDGISDEQRTMAAKKLVALYRDQLHEDPPSHLLDMAHERSADTVGLTNLSEDIAEIMRGLVERIEALEGRYVEDNANTDGDGPAAQPPGTEHIEETESDIEEEEEEDDAERGVETVGMSLRAALIAEGIMPEDGVFSLAEIIALEG